jgi:ATP-dependent RNA helicase DDX18/HAS1
MERYSKMKVCVWTILGGLALTTTLSTAFVPVSLRIHQPIIMSTSSLHVSMSKRSDRRGSFYDDNADKNDDDGSNSNRPRREGNSRGRGPPRRNNRDNNGNDLRNRDNRNTILNRNDDDNEDPFGDFDSTPIDITDTNTHFYSKKPLDDPTFRASQGDLFRPLCQGAGITRPSRIQSLAWPQILSGKHTIVADQTGSGKTLAYLLPLLQRALSVPSKKVNGAPKLLILAPTAELADQIQAVCTKISETVPFKTMVVTATGKYTTSIRDQIRMIQRTPVDVMISTPGRVSTILRTRNSGLNLEDLQAIVLDEVDILLIDETFGPQLRTVGAAAPLDKTQFVFVTATLPDTIVKKVEKEFIGVQQVRGPGLHRVAPTVKQRLVDCSVPAEYNRDPAHCFDVKQKALLKALRQNRCRRTLIFCNTVESCRDVENLLTRKDRRGQLYEVGAYHNAMTPEARNSNLATFAKGRRDNHNDKVDYVLICTDRAARGVDFEQAPVDHVVIFDFPKDPAEYVRRVGRTARAGRTGATSVFAYGWQLPIARQVMGSKLDSVTIAIQDNDDEEEDNMRSRRQQNRSKDEVVKGNIERGRLWD